MKADPTALRIVYGIGEKMININHHSADHDQEGPPPPIKIECPRYKRRNNEMKRQVNKWTHHFRINLSKQLRSLFTEYLQAGRGGLSCHIWGQGLLLRFLAKSSLNAKPQMKHEPAEGAC